MANNKQMETKLYNLVSCLADNFGFDADAAFEYVRWETDVDHVGEILKMISGKEEKPAKKTEQVKDDVSEAPTESSAGGDVMEKIAACKKNIDLWQKKLDEGKVKDADKQTDKIAKEKAKLAKLEAKAPKVEEKPKPAPKIEAKPAKDEAKEKRIKRFSPVMSSQLKTAVEAVGLEMNDKLKKEFQQYIEDLTDDDFRASGFADHMRAFAKAKAPAVTAAAASADDDEVEEITKEIEELTVKEKKSFPKPSNAAGGGPNTVELSVDQLKEISMTAELDTPGTFWDADNGRFVKGPDADEDEDVVEMKFNNKDYVVGEKTHRVYEVRDTGDVFSGFAGVGKFKGMCVA